MKKEPDLTAPFEVIQDEASYWWRTNRVSGTILYRLMLLFIFVPLTLVYYRHYIPSFLVFAGIIPYGYLLRYLAKRSVTLIIQKHPEALDHFEREGVIVR